MTGTNNSANHQVTQYNLITGGTSNLLNNVAPSATSGVPVISQGSSSQPTFGTAVVAGGGTGVTSNTAYAVLCGGTTATGAIQSIAGVGTAGQVLTSNGAAALPTFQDSAAVTYTVTALDNTDSPYTVLSTDYYMTCDVSAAALTIRLPDAPSTGRVYIVKDATGSAATFNITVTTGGGAVTIDGSTSFVMNTAYQAANFLFNGSSYEVF